MSALITNKLWVCLRDLGLEKWDGQTGIDAKDSWMEPGCHVHILVPDQIYTPFIEQMLDIKSEDNKHKFRTNSNGMTLY